MTALDLLSTWPAPRRAGGWWKPSEGTGDQTPGATDAFALASVTKPLFAYAVLVAVEEGTLALDQPVGLDAFADESPATGGTPAATPATAQPTTATVADLLAHSSGMAPDERRAMAQPRTRRIYSNAGFELLGDLLEDASGFSAAAYFHEAVAAPLGLSRTRLEGSPAHGAVSTVADLVRFGHELLHPTLISEATKQIATSPHLADVPGVLPGFGSQAPNPWGLGFEIRGTKIPHWTGSQNHPDTFGHFGRAGTMFWVDPRVGMVCVALSDLAFGPWASTAWPALSDAVLDEGT